MTIEEFQKKFGIIGKSKEIKDLVDIVMQVAPTDISVLIYGESGVGKEIFARAIHNYSKRAAQQLLSVNCGAIPEGILESELFGHKKGSFTGAIESRKGYFELADGGTLFLDEIGEMPLSTQVKLLRAIETKEFMKVGSESSIKVDVRIIAATNKDLQIEVNSKRFREDLYFRLKAVTINIPPLRKRTEDIPLLVEHFIKEFCEANKINNITIESDALNLLINYPWPGNIRELKNTIETAIALSKNGKLTAEIFVPLLKLDEEKSLNRNYPVRIGKSLEEVDREFLYRALFEIKRDILELKNLILEKSEATSVNTKKEDESDIMDINEAEKMAIISALKKTNGNKRKTAELLNISERTLYRKIKDYNIH